MLNFLEASSFFKNDVVFFLSFLYLLKYCKVSAFIFSVYAIFIYSLFLTIYDALFKNIKKDLESQREITLLSSISAVPLSSAGEENCEICYDIIEKDEKSYTLNCNCSRKIYHKKCILQWFKKSPTCPFCRKQFRDA